jgi:hypothetical protein
MATRDRASFCGLLRKNRKWLAQFKSHELAELMDAAIHATEATDDFVGELLQAGVPAHCVHDHIGPEYQHTPLITAARLGRLDLVQSLVAAGANLFWTSPTGANALSDDLDCVRLLLAAGAEVNATDGDGWTCLFHLRSEPVARCLLEHGALPGIADQCGGLPEATDLLAVLSRGDGGVAATSRGVKTIRKPRGPS